MPHSAPAAQPTSVPLGTCASSRGSDPSTGRPPALPLLLNPHAGLPTSSSRPTLAFWSLQAHETATGPARQREMKLHPCSWVVGSQKPLLPAPSAPPRWLAVARQGPRAPGGCGILLLSPHPVPQPEDSSRLDFILLFQPLPPATRWQKAGLSSTALKQSRGFLQFLLLPGSLVGAAYVPNLCSWW